MDLKLLGEIYTKGSWGVSAETNYNKRYRYRGNLYFSFLRTVEGEKNMPDYAVTKSLKLQWTHTKDSKANPNTSFSARVNFASENYERSNLESMYNPLSYTQSTRSQFREFQPHVSEHRPYDFGFGQLDAEHEGLEHCRDVARPQHFALQVLSLQTQTPVGQGAVVRKKFHVVHRTDV